MRLTEILQKKGKNRIAFWSRVWLNIYSFFFSSLARAFRTPRTIGNVYIISLYIFRIYNWQPLHPCVYTIYLCRLLQRASQHNSEQTHNALISFEWHTYHPHRSSERRENVCRAVLQQYMCVWNVRKAHHLWSACTMTHHKPYLSYPKTKPYCNVQIIMEMIHLVRNYISTMIKNS